VNDKHSLRFQLRKSRKAFEKEHLFYTGVGCHLPGQFRHVLAIAEVVAGYVQVGSEVDPAGLMQLAASMGKTLALPWLANRTAPIMFREWKTGEPLETAPFGFRQPLATVPKCVPDMILTPLVGFDRALNRLGQGAGHYDRAFAACPDSLRIGLAWSVQECAALTPDPWDVPLDAVLTEKEWITGPQSRIRP